MGNVNSILAAPPAPRWTLQSVSGALVLTLATFLLMPYLERLAHMGVTRHRPVAVDSTHIMSAPPPPPPLDRPKPRERTKSSKTPKPKLRRHQKTPVPLSAVLGLELSPAGLVGDFDLGFAIRPHELPGTDPAEIVFEVSDIDQSPQPVVQLHPVYPPQARMRRQEGTVVLEFVVSPGGGTSDIRVISSRPGDVFVRSAVRAVKRWRFTPGTKEGLAVPVRVRQKISFRLE